MEKWLYYSTKVPEWCIWLVFTTALALTANYVAGGHIWLNIIYFPHFIFLAALANSEKLTGIFVARRGTMAVTSVIIVAIMCAVVAHISSSRLNGSVESSNHVVDWPDSLDVRTAIALVIMGSIIGALLRNGVSRLLDLTLLGKKRLGQNILLTAIWTAGIIVFPWGSHITFAFLYIGGATIGVVISRSFRLQISKAIAGFRRLHEVFDAWPRDAMANVAELEALELLAKGRQLPFQKFRKLRNKIEDWRGTGVFTKRIALISSALYRIEGNYSGAIAEADLGSIPPDDLEDVHLLLLKALSLYEMEGEEKGDESLDEILKTKKGQECPLATATLSLRLAQKSLSCPGAAVLTGEPLKRICQALDFRRGILNERARKSEKNAGDGNAIDRFVARYTEIGIPLTAPFMLDILGYSLIVGGYPDEGRIFLERCIEIDRSYASAYLHLGDYFLYRSEIKGIPRNKKHEEWHARACYYAVLSLEKGKVSNSRRRALSRLDQIQELQDLKPDV